MGDDNGRGILMSALCFGVFLLGFAIGNSMNEFKWKKDMIKRGDAEYNSQTGDWQWIESDAEFIKTGPQ